MAQNVKICGAWSCRQGRRKTRTQQNLLCGRPTGIGCTIAGTRAGRALARWRFHDDLQTVFPSGKPPASVVPYSYAGFDRVRRVEGESALQLPRSARRLRACGRGSVRHAWQSLWGHNRRGSELLPWYCSVRHRVSTDAPGHERRCLDRDRPVHLPGQEPQRREHSSRRRDDRRSGQFVWDNCLRWRGQLHSAGDKCGMWHGVRLSPPAQKGGAWRETVLYNFKGDTDGQLPIGDLVFDKQGNLHGATQYGGGYGSCNPSFYQHCGTVFKLSPPKTKGGKWTEKVLHGFKGGMDGANPNGGLVFDGTGAIYGTTSAGGNTNCTGAGFVVRHCVRAGISHRERRCVWRKDPPSLPELPHRRGTPVSWPDVRWQWLPLRYYRRWRRLRRGNSIQIGTTSKGR